MHVFTLYSVILLKLGIVFNEYFKKIQTRGVHVYRVLVLFSFIKISPARAANCIYLHFQMFCITLY